MPEASSGLMPPKNQVGGKDLIKWVKRVKPLRILEVFMVFWWPLVVFGPFLVGLLVDFNGCLTKVPFWESNPIELSFKRLFRVFTTSYRGFDPQPCMPWDSNECFFWSNVRKD